LKYILFLLVIFLITTIPAFAAPNIEDQDFIVEKFVGNLSEPTAMHFIDNDILVLEKGGKVLLIKNGVLEIEPILQIDVDTAFDRGLLGITSVNSTLFLFFTEAEKASTGPVGNRIYRYDWNGQELQNGLLIHDLPVNYTLPEHNGGNMVTGLDGTVYAVLGDASHEGILQNFNKGNFDDTSVILYVDQTGSTLKPRLSENPQNFYHAIGIRNSFGLAIDSKTGYLWDTENGPEYFDEINLVEPKFNSGWKKVMGPANQEQRKSLEDYQGFVYSDPEFSWETTVGPTALTFVDSELFGKYEDYLLVGEFHTGKIYKFKLNSERNGFVFEDPQLADQVLNRDEESDEIIFATGFLGITDIVFGPDDFLYVISYGDGTIYRIIPSDSFEIENVIPGWLKKNVSWWNNYQIGDNTFFQSIKYLIENYVIILSKIPVVENESESTIPLFKKNATSWGKNQISDKEFGASIEFLISGSLIELDWDEMRCNSPLKQDVDLSDCDLSGKDFSRMDISLAKIKNSYLNGSNFFETDLRNTDFSNSNLVNTNLEKANLRGANLTNADLGGAYLFGANLINADISNANLVEANLTEVIISPTTIFSGANLMRADLNGVDLSKINLKQINLIGAILTNVNLKLASLHDGNLTGANLMGADLRGSILQNVDLSGANLMGADLRGSILQNTDLSGANLMGADLRGSILQNVDLSGANLQGADMSGAFLDEVKIRHANFEDVITVGCYGCP